MTQEPQQPPVGPDPAAEGGAPQPGQPQWGQPAPAPQPGQPWGQPNAGQPGQPWGQPNAAQPQQPEPPRWGQYAPHPGQPPWGQTQPGQQQPGQPQPGQPWGQPQQPQWGQPHPGQPYPGQPAFGQQPYPGQQPQWGQPQQPAYGQPQYGQPQYSQPQWGQPGGYVAPPKPGVIPLRPLRLGEVLDGAFQAARRNGKAMFGSALIFQMASAALTLVVMALAFGQLGLSILNGTFVSDETHSLTPEQVDSFMTTMLQVGGGLILVTMVTTLAEMVLQGALVIPVLRDTLNRRTGFGQMWRLVRPRTGSLVLLAGVYMVAMLAGLLAYVGLAIGLYFALGRPTGEGPSLGFLGLLFLLMLPFLALLVWLSVKVMLAPAAVVCEDLGAFAGIRRSWALTQRNWWRAFGISALAAIIAGVIASIISMPLSLLMGFLMPVLTPHPTTDQLLAQTLITQGISSFIGALVGAVTLAFQSGVMALIYVDLRMRRDGFDVTLMKEAENGTDDGGIPGHAIPAPQAWGGGQPLPGASPYGPRPGL